MVWLETKMNDFDGIYDIKGWEDLRFWIWGVIYPWQDSQRAGEQDTIRSVVGFSNWDCQIIVATKEVVGQVFTLSPLPPAPRMESVQRMGFLSRLGH
jgi:hypothetical protein